MLAYPIRTAGTRLPAVSFPQIYGVQRTAQGYGKVPYVSRMVKKRGKKHRKPVADIKSARVELRFTQDLKERAEAAAKEDGRSLNSWIVRLVGENC